MIRQLSSSFSLSIQKNKLKIVKAANNCATVLSKQKSNSANNSLENLRIELKWSILQSYSINDGAYY
jgi:hypothetical protein